MTKFWLALCCFALVINMAGIVFAMFLLYNGQPITVTALAVNIVLTIILASGISYDAGRNSN